MESEQLWIMRILNGDLEAFNILVSHYQSRIFNFIYKSTYNREDAEELTQEVFIRVYNYLNRFDMQRNFSTWIFTIAVNILRTELKKKKKSKIDFVDEFPDIPGTNLFDQPETALDKKETRTILKKLINELTEDQKMALLLKHLQGFSFKEIGDILSISPEAAKMKVQRAKHAIIKGFEEINERSVS